MKKWANLIPSFRSAYGLCVGPVDKVDNGAGEGGRGMAEAHASKQMTRSPGKLVLLPGLDLLEVEHLKQEADELVMLE